ncbi:PREDICTED: uncharacterized protein LOC109583773 [Amphimedon queenslandica]|uniref:Death domain-containing protein n=1 Tax=Amphimedon queenslandica TaxID=400682 RepID=A0A1X7UFC9_AMPQE|nr:PREDICTED: uncharacterized protein LOC109583773 [Amphimedon queenslandica]|eukprot:XP_019854790.1 PREDICTED: uncharacterized protein LOC109583773 [Amphimedon queenslandica]
MSRQPESSQPPSLAELLRALKDTRADKTYLLVLMGLELDTVRKMEIQNCRQEDRTFMECLDYYLKNCARPGQEWEQIVKALIDSKDPQTAEEIRRTYLSSSQTLEPNDSTATITSAAPASSVETDEVDQSYLMFEPPSQPHPPLLQLDSTETDELMDYLKKMKTMTRAKYNEAKTNIEGRWYDIESTLEREHDNATRELSNYKQRVERSSDKLERNIQELKEKTTDQQAVVKDAISKLKQGDSTRLVAIKETSDEILELEKLTHSLEKNLERYKRHTPKPYISSATKDTVIQDLQEILSVGSTTCSELDESEYMYECSLWK